jgi:hypothetical protein
MAAATSDGMRWCAVPIPANTGVASTAGNEAVKNGFRELVAAAGGQRLGHSRWLPAGAEAFWILLKGGDVQSAAALGSPSRSSHWPMEYSAPAAPIGL